MISINSGLKAGDESMMNESLINEVIEQVQQEIQTQLIEIEKRSKLSESRVAELEKKVAKLVQIEEKFEELEKKVMKMIKDQDDQVDLLSAKIGTTIKKEVDFIEQLRSLKASLEYHISSMEKKKMESPSRVLSPLSQTVNMNTPLSNIPDFETEDQDSFTPFSPIVRTRQGAQPKNSFPVKGFRMETIPDVIVNKQKKQITASLELKKARKISSMSIH